MEGRVIDYSLKRAYQGGIWVAPPGAEPVTGGWRTSNDRKKTRYFYVDKKARPDVKAYGRPSKAGNNLKGNSDSLADWKAAMAAIGTLMSETAASKITALINQYDGDPWYRGDDEGSQSGKSRLKEAVEMACDCAQANSASARGSEFHGYWELLNHGKTPKLIRPDLRPHVDRYLERVRPIRFIDAEVVLVNDDVKRAGSMDHFMELPAGLTTPDGVLHDEPMLVGGDGKTGKWDTLYPAGVYAQLATYVLGFRYNQETNERLPIHPRLNTKWGVMIHYPIANEDAEVSFYWIDLELGLKAAKMNNALEDMISFLKSAKGRPQKFEMVA